MATPNRASQGAHSEEFRTVHPETPSQGQEKGNVMKHVTQIWTAFAFVLGFVATLAGCVDAPPSEEDPVAVTSIVEVKASACKDDVAVKPSFCENGLTLKYAVWNQASDSVNPSAKADELDLDFDSEGEATGSIDLPTPGEYLLEFEGLDDGYTVTSGGFTPNGTVKLKRGENVSIP